MSSNSIHLFFCILVMLPHATEWKNEEDEIPGVCQRASFPRQLVPFTDKYAVGFTAIDQRWSTFGPSYSKSIALLGSTRDIYPSLFRLLSRRGLRIMGRSPSHPNPTITVFTNSGSSLLLLQKLSDDSLVMLTVFRLEVFGSFLDQAWNGCSM